MEELQSTEILAQEILEDARKRAQRILKSADDMVKSKSVEWEKKTAETLRELDHKYEEQGRLDAHEIMTFLPIDKRRAKAKRIEELLGAAVEQWYAGLGRKKVLALLQQELAQRVAFCGGFADSASAYRASIHKLDRAEAKAILQAVLPGKTCAIEETYSPSPYPELVLERGDLRVYASIGKTVEFFLGEQRAELAEALLGKAALHDAEEIVTADAAGEGLC